MFGSAPEDSREFPFSAKFRRNGRHVREDRGSLNRYGHDTSDQAGEGRSTRFEKKRFQPKENGSLRSKVAKLSSSDLALSLKAKDYPILLVESRQELAQRFFNCYPSIARSSRIYSKIVAFFDKDTGSLVALAPQGSTASDSGTALNHRKLYKFLQASAEGEIFVLLLNTLIIQGGSNDKRYDERSIFQFLKHTEVEAAQHRLKVAVPTLAGIAENIKSTIVHSALKKLFQNPLIDPDNTISLTEFLNPRLSDLYLGQSLNTNSEEKLLSFLTNLSELFDRLALHRDYAPAAKNLIEVLDSIQHSGFLRGMDREKQKAESNFIRDFKSFLEEREKFRIKHGERPRHIRMEREASAETNYLAAYSIPSVLMSTLLEEQSANKSFQPIANLYSLIGRTSPHWLNYFQQLINVKELPVVLKDFYSSVYEILGRMTAQTNLCPSTVIDSKDSAYREILFKGSLDQYDYQLTASLRSKSPLISLRRLKNGAEEEQSEFLGIAKEGHLHWTKENKDSQMASVSTRILLPSERLGGIENLMSSLLAESSKLKLESFIENRFLGRQQSVSIVKIANNQYELGLRLRYGQQESHVLKFDKGKLVSIEQAAIVLNEKLGTERFVPLRRGLLNPKEGYPFILDIIDALKKHTATTRAQLINAVQSSSEVLKALSGDENRSLKKTWDSNDNGPEALDHERWVDDPRYRFRGRGARVRRRR